MFLVSYEFTPLSHESIPPLFYARPLLGAGFEVDVVSSGCAVEKNAAKGNDGWRQHGGAEPAQSGQKQHGDLLNLENAAFINKPGDARKMQLLVSQ